jgi:uncharacterized alpha/beta hydrolase family protein
MYTPPPTAGFSADTKQVNSEWLRLQNSPAILKRPLVVISGWRGTGSRAASIARALQQRVGYNDNEIIVIANPLSHTIEAAVEHTIRRVESKWPSADQSRTIEVDVVGFSMGGIVARQAAIPVAHRKSLTMTRLYTLATPHNGTTRWGDLFELDGSARQMQKGSAFLDELNAQLQNAAYELTCYAILGDSIVGAQNSSPPGQPSIWSVAPARMSHFAITRNKRVLTDIALRLRGEPPLQEGGSIPPKN